MVQVELIMVLNVINDAAEVEEINASKRVTMPVCPMVGMKIALHDPTGKVWCELEVTTVYWEEDMDHVEAYFADDRYHRKHIIEHIIANGWT